MTDDDKPAPDQPAPAEPASESPKVTRLADRRMREGAKRVTRATEPHLVRLAQCHEFLGGDCPYEPLGYDGETLWIQQASGHVRGVRARDLSRNMLVMICGNEKWLERTYPRFRRGKPVDGFAAERASNDLIRACCMMAFWQPDQRIRGLGAWLADDGDLVLHRGDHLVVRGKAVALGRHGEFLYVPDRPLPPLPFRDVPDPTREAGAELLARLDSFQWTRGSWDSWLMFCWICAAMVGGALKFRPHIWIPGDFGVGKSMLQSLLTAVFGRWGMVSVTDATPAGIWQAVQFRCVPIGCDEMEPSPTSQRSANMINFARQASTGGHIVRGSAAHQATEFTIQSAFCCSSIIIPPMPSQDRSRFAILELRHRDQAAPRVPFDMSRLEQIGAGLILRMTRRFEQLTTDIMPTTRGMLLAAGWPERSADLYSALLASGMVALHDDIAEMRLEQMITGHQMKRALDDIRTDQTPEWRRMLDYLLSTRTERQRAESVTIGELVSVASRPLLVSKGTLMQRSMLESDRDDLPDDDQGRASKARERLLSFGIKVDWREMAEGGREPCIIIANTHRQLADLFYGSVWGTTPDAAAGGGWSQVLRRAPGAAVVNTTRFRQGITARGTSVALDIVTTGTGPAPDGPAAMDTDRPAAGRIVH